MEVSGIRRNCVGRHFRVCGLH